MTEPTASGDTGASSTPGSGSTQSGDGSAPGSTQQTGGTFTQEQVGRLVADERRKTEAKYGDYEATKARLAELEAASQTELERAQKTATEADARASAATEQRNRLLARSAVTAEAARAGALDPDVVVALLADSITVDDKGEIAADVKLLVATLLEEKPFLKNGGSTTIGSADGGAHGRAGAASGSASTPSGGMDELLRKSR